MLGGGEAAAGQEQLRSDDRPQGALMARDDIATANLQALINFVADTNLAAVAPCSSSRREHGDRLVWL